MNYPSQIGIMSRRHDAKAQQRRAQQQAHSADQGIHLDRRATGTQQAGRHAAQDHSDEAGETSDQTENERYPAQLNISYYCTTELWLWNILIDD